MGTTAEACRPQIFMDGGEVYNAYPIHNQIRNINPTSLKMGVHVIENFAGVGLGVLRMTVVAGIKVRVYTYIDRDPVSRKIARHVLLQLQLQQLSPSTASTCLRTFHLLDRLPSPTW